jgi:hypothetical protein
MGDGVDLSAIFNEVNAIASLSATKVAGDLSHGANAIPKGTSTSDLTWPGTNRTLRLPFNWSSHASDWGIASPTNVAVVCNWDAGGSYNGAGQFLANVHLSFTVDSIGLGQSFDVSGSFDDPTPQGDHDNPIAVLTARLTLNHNFAGMLMESYSLVFNLHGDGSGTANKQ